MKNLAHLIILFICNASACAASEQDLLLALRIPVPSIVMNNMIMKSLVSTSSEEITPRSVAHIYTEIDASGGIDALCRIPDIRELSLLYRDTIVSDTFLQSLIKSARQLKNENRSHLKRAIAWAQVEATYILLQNRLLSQALPFITLQPSLFETLTVNKHICLDDYGKKHFCAALLSIGCCMQGLFDSDPVNFYLTFRQHMPEELKLSLCLALEDTISQ